MNFLKKNLELYVFNAYIFFMNKYNKTKTSVFNVGYHLIWFPNIEEKPTLWTRSYYLESVGHISENI
ncbi:MAG: hypothetical protein AMS24_03005 [Chlamydiae bacterium SM23_39]|nr:MAG: hypothetical protein AMS24_03005 [Chlamydiae bacterium SM23_39]